MIPLLPSAAALTPEVPQAEPTRESWIPVAATWMPPPAEQTAAPAEAPLADEAARLRAWIGTPAATITITQGNETRSLERDCADAAARIESDAARIREHEALLGKIAMAAMQEAWDDVRDLTRGLKVTFPDGSPHVSLAAPDSAAEQGEAK